MTVSPSPVRWAIDLSVLLNTVLGTDRFPVNVPSIAKEYSAQRYPDDPISSSVKYGTFRPVLAEGRD